MELLTYADYQGISPNPVEPDVFGNKGRLNAIATDIVNRNIRNFYRGKDFEKDHEWRKEAVKRAITYQVDFLSESGVTTLEQLQDEPLSFSAGRTSVTNSNTQSQKAPRSTLLSLDARDVLTSTGLLYRGVDSL